MKKLVPLFSEYNSKKENFYFDKKMNEDFAFTATTLFNTIKNPENDKKPSKTLWSFDVVNDTTTEKDAIDNIIQLLSKKHTFAELNTDVDKLFDIIGNLSDPNHKKLCEIIDIALIKTNVISNFNNDYVPSGKGLNVQIDLDEIYGLNYYMCLRKYGKDSSNIKQMEVVKPILIRNSYRGILGGFTVSNTLKYFVTVIDTLLENSNKNTAISKIPEHVLFKNNQFDFFKLLMLLSLEGQEFSNKVSGLDNADLIWTLIRETIKYGKNLVANTFSKAFVYSKEFSEILSKFENAKNTETSTSNTTTTQQSGEKQTANTSSNTSSTSKSVDTSGLKTNLGKSWGADLRQGK